MKHIKDSELEKTFSKEDLESLDGLMEMLSTNVNESAADKKELVMQMIELMFPDDSEEKRKTMIDEILTIYSK